uniref:Uncharacterized protein n=1 Tax=Arundo donax TaxID=35708 RepID=A0A0A9ER88_ARUDO
MNTRRMTYVGKNTLKPAPTNTQRTKGLVQLTETVATLMFKLLALDIHKYKQKTGWKCIRIVL